MQVSDFGKKVKRSLVLFLSLAVLFSFALSLKKQLIAQKQMSRNLSKKQVELKQFEEENRSLQKRLKETEEPGFANKEAAKLLGMSNDNEPIIIPKEEKKEKEAVFIPETPNYQKWFKLFWY